MKIAAFRLNGTPSVGLVSKDATTVQPFTLGVDAAALGALPIIEALARGEALPALQTAVPLSSVQLTAPLPRPRRNIFCVGKNYIAHAKEFAGSGFDSSAKAGGDIPSVPIYFTKVPESVVGPSDFIDMPVGVSDAIDYEAELTVVIGKGGKGIKAADAMKHVWGYTIIN
ncbi:MAG: fumarylacetoacetate hydrolase family protein, partial [Burkholderiaceae bacterium]